MYLLSCRGSRTSVQILAVSTRGNQEKTRERVIHASEYRIFLFLPSFSHSERHLSISKVPFLALFPPPLSLFLSCQAIMRDRNFPRARSGGNTSEYKAITISVQSIYLSRREIHGSFCRGFCNRIERSRRTNLPLRKFRAVPDITEVSRWIFFRATRNKASLRIVAMVSPYIYIYIVLLKREFFSSKLQLCRVYSSHCVLVNK